MSTLGAILIGILCTALSFVWLFAMNKIPFFSTDLATIVIVVALAVAALLLVISMKKYHRALTIFANMITAPLTCALLLPLFGAESAFLRLSLPRAAMAIGGALLLMLIYLVIINAMDVVRHRFAPWLAFAFFFAVTVGIYFILKMAISPDFAATFSTAAIVSIFSVSSSLNL
ncbi:MAG: hypothetical protein E7663_01505 [Ruminococcaceae bacterium]|nr:hypothetical protein [Oscillospiraceae bacterium]